MPLPSLNVSSRSSLLRPEDLGRLAAVAAREAGIKLGADKTSFLVSRLSGVAEQAGVTSFSEYCDLLEDPGAQAHVDRFVEAITTHTTSFFRESGHFDWLAEAGLAALWKEGAGRSRDLVFWSAACSTGQELYSAMICTQHAAAKHFPNLRYRGLGTDISTKVVSQAEAAVYPKEEIAGIPMEMRSSSLLISKSGDGRCRISPDLRRRTEWRVGNLTKSGSLRSVLADVAFLRNVLIYFDGTTQNAVLRNVLSRIRPGGYLLTGHSETSQARDLNLEVIRPTIYRKDW